MRSEPDIGLLQLHEHIRSQISEHLSLRGKPLHFLFQQYWLSQLRFYQEKVSSHHHRRHRSQCHILANGRLLHESLLHRTWHDSLANWLCWIIHWQWNLGNISRLSFNNQYLESDWFWSLQLHSVDGSWHSWDNSSSGIWPNHPKVLLEEENQQSGSNRWQNESSKRSIVKWLNTGRRGT